MIIGNLHRKLKIHQPPMDCSLAAEVNAIVVAGAESGDV
jgi:hypothetical protein